MGSRNRNVILNYNGGGGKYDSWDVENLKYIRRKSQSNLLEDDETNSNQVENYNFNRFKESEPNFNIDKTFEEGFSLITTKPLLHSHSEANLNGKKNPTGFPQTSSRSQNTQENSKISSKKSAEEEPDVRLDDCYLLDVVTVRNESVLADTSKNSQCRVIPKNLIQIAKPRASKIPIFVGSKVIPKIGPNVNTILSLKGRNGSTGSNSNESHSSASSISDIEDSPNHLSNPRLDLGNQNQAQRQCDPMRSEKSPMYVQGGSVSSQSVCSSDKQRAGCPFCSDSSSSSSSYYYLSRGDQGGISADEQRTPSPYYVRLRRDLCNFSPTLCAPSNFGVDKQGQLVIDYSQNWEGLENYIRNLQLS